MIVRDKKLIHLFQDRPETKLEGEEEGLYLGSDASITPPRSKVVGMGTTVGRWGSPYVGHDLGQEVEVCLNGW